MGKCIKIEEANWDRFEINCLEKIIPIERERDMANKKINILNQKMEKNNQEMDRKNQEMNRQNQENKNAIKIIAKKFNISIEEATKMIE